GLEVCSADAEYCVAHLTQTAGVRSGAVREAQHRRLAGAVRAHQRHPLAAPHLEVEALVHARLAVALLDALEREHRIADARRRRDAQAQARRVALGLGRRLALHALEHLDAALHLARLARLVPEALDEALELGAPPRLVGAPRLELLAAQRARRLVGVPVAGIDGEPAVRELGDARDVLAQ